MYAAHRSCCRCSQQYAISDNIYCNHLFVCCVFSTKQGSKNEVYQLTLAVDCVLTLAELLCSPSSDVNRAGNREHDDNDKDSEIPALSLTHVELLLEPLLRQTFFAMFPTLARAQIGENSYVNLEYISSTTSSSCSDDDSVHLRDSLSVVEWKQAHVAEAPAVRSWWTSVNLRLPADTMFSTIGNVERNFGVPYLRRQVGDLLLSADKFAANALNFRRLAVPECRHVAQMCASIIGMFHERHAFSLQNQHRVGVSHFADQFLLYICPSTTNNVILAFLCCFKNEFKQPISRLRRVTTMLYL